MIVSLSGWSIPREIIEHDGKLYFKLIEHSHCFTCLSRIENVRSLVLKNKLQVVYAYLLNYSPLSDDTLWVGIEKPKNKMSDDQIINFFCENFELPVLGN